VRDLVVDADLRPRFVLESPWGRVEVTLAVRGAHQAQNAAMAATVALGLGVAPESVAAGLADAVTASWRMEIVTTPSGIVVLNDAYNANPDSMRAALRSLGDLPAGRRVAVLGDMLELGDHAEAEHAALADLAVHAGVELLVAVGPHSAVTAAHAERAGIITLHAADRDEARALVEAHVRPGDAVLVKASRGIGLESVAEALTGGGDDR
jgi:UDP-N-acetylmuramoyl-tripeptide--D-alanyl-D-alanine ligase